MQQELSVKNKLSKEYNHLSQVVQSHSQALNIQFEIIPEKKKRHRRNASEIKKTWMCPIDGCKRKYGTEGSLGQHMKLKHAEEYKKIMMEVRR